MKFLTLTCDSVYHQSFQNLDSIVLTVNAVLEQLSNQSPTARISRSVFQQMSVTTIQYFLSTNDADHDLMPVSDEHPEILTPENTAQDTPSPFTSNLVDYWKPQCSSLNCLEQITPSLDPKVGFENKQFHKKNSFLESIQLPCGFDNPHLLSQPATEQQGIEGFSKLPFDSSVSERNFRSTDNDLKLLYGTSFGIVLQDEQSSNSDMPIPRIDDDLLGDFLVGWADSGSSQD